MKYWVRLDKERIMADYDEEDLLDGSGMDCIYLIRQLRFYIEHGENMLAADEDDIMFPCQIVKMRDGSGRDVFVPCTIHGEVGNV